MPTTNPSLAQLTKLVADLRRERQEHADAIVEIDNALAGFGIQAGDTASPKRRGRPRKNAAGTASAAPATKRTGKKKRGRRGSFKETAGAFILGLLNKARTTAELNEAWQTSGRGGLANNTLTLLTKAGQVKRENIEGGRGSKYSRA